MLKVKEKKRGQEKETENRNKEEQYYAPVCNSLYEWKHQRLDH